jgi:hypothetical protein
MSSNEIKIVNKTEIENGKLRVGVGIEDSKEIIEATITTDTEPDAEPVFSLQLCVIAPRVDEWHEAQHSKIPYKIK